MIKLAFYGKGGIGKSTAASNVSIALTTKGLKEVPCQMAQAQRTQAPPYSPWERGYHRS